MSEFRYSFLLLLYETVLILLLGIGEEGGVGRKFLIPNPKNAESSGVEDLKM